MGKAMSKPRDDRQKDLLLPALDQIIAGTDEAGHAFQLEAGRVFQSEAGHPWRQSHGSI